MACNQLQHVTKKIVELRKRETGSTSLRFSPGLKLDLGRKAGRLKLSAEEQLGKCWGSGGRKEGRQESGMNFEFEVARRK